MVIYSKSPIGKKALQEKTAALIGLSIRNSYFKEDNLRELITWAKDNFQHILLMLPDIPAISTLRSLGFSESKARQRAMLACNNLENKCNRIIAELSIGDRARVIRWKDVEGNDGYEAMLNKLNELYKNNEDFQADVRSTTEGVIENQGTTLPVEEAIDIGITFILKELACILNAADIFGVPSCAYIYHQEMPVHVKLLKKEYPFDPPQNNGYIIAKTDHFLSGRK